MVLRETKNARVFYTYLISRINSNSPTTGRCTSSSGDSSTSRLAFRIRAMIGKVSVSVALKTQRPPQLVLHQLLCCEFHFLLLCHRHLCHHHLYLHRFLSLQVLNHHHHHSAKKCGFYDRFHFLLLVERMCSKHRGCWLDPLDIYRFPKQKH